MSRHDNAAPRSTRVVSTSTARVVSTNTRELANRVASTTVQLPITTSVQEDYSADDEPDSPRLKALQAEDPQPHHPLRHAKRPREATTSSSSSGGGSGGGSSSSRGKPQPRGPAWSSRDLASPLPDASPAMVERLTLLVQQLSHTCTPEACAAALQYLRVLDGLAAGRETRRRERLPERAHVAMPRGRVYCERSARANGAMVGAKREQQQQGLQIYVSRESWLVGQSMLAMHGRHAGGSRPFTAGPRRALHQQRSPAR